MDCSWPLGLAVNDGIDKESYLGHPVKLKYPTIDKVARKVHEMSNIATLPIYFFKEDMDRAFRQLPACPGSVPLLGFRWRGRYYFDLVMMMGCRSAPYVCQRTSSMITYIHAEMGYFSVNYVDDFLGIDYVTKIYDSHSSFIRMMKDIGASRAEHKSTPPTQVIEFVGNLIDAENMQLAVTPQRKCEIMQELDKWRHKKTCTRTQLESIIGKLQFVSNVVRPGRLFVSRLLAEMKTMSRGHWYTISDEIRKDLKWWYIFIPQFQGTGILWLLDSFSVDEEFAVDACLTGAGGCCKQQYFRTRFPKELLTSQVKITHLELWAIIIGVKLWGHHMT